MKKQLLIAGFLLVNLASMAQLADIGKGLKEALNQGVSKTINQVSQADGFFGNAAIKILMPPEAEK